MSRKLTKLFWCGIFVTVFGAYLLLTNLLSIITFIGFYESVYAHSSLGNTAGIYYALTLSIVMLVFYAVLVAVGAYVIKKGIVHEQPLPPPAEPPVNEPVA